MHSFLVAHIPVFDVLDLRCSTCAGVDVLIGVENLVASMTKPRITHSTRRSNRLLFQIYELIIEPMSACNLTRLKQHFPSARAQS